MSELTIGNQQNTLGNSTLSPPHLGNNQSSSNRTTAPYSPGLKAQTTLKRPRGRPRTKPVELGPKRRVGRPSKPKDSDNDVVKRRPGRPTKKPLPTGSVVFEQLKGPIIMPGTQRNGANTSQAVHPLFRQLADLDGDPSIPPPETIPNTVVNEERDQDTSLPESTPTVGQQDDNIGADDLGGAPEIDDVNEPDGGGLGYEDEADEDDEDDNDDDEEVDLGANDEHCSSEDPGPAKTRKRRPLPDWLKALFCAKLAELEQRDSHGLPALYAKNKTFWFPKQSVYFTLQAEGTNISPGSIYDIQFFGWDPKALVPNLPCPNCRCKLNRHSPIPRPRRCIDIDSVFYLIGFRYKCTNCINPKTKKRTITFRSWDRRILDVLPPILASDFPAHLTHRSAISHRLCTLTRSCFMNGLEEKRLADAIREQHVLRYDELQLKYYNFLLSRPMDRFVHHKKYKLFPPFEDTSADGFHGYVPSATYLRDKYDDYVHEYMPIIAQRQSMIPCEIISIDHSFKIPKHTAKLDGEPIFPGLFACATERGFCRLLDLVTSKSHAQAQQSLDGVHESMTMYGLSGPILAYTDTVGDRALLETSFPSLREGIVPLDKYGTLPPYILPLNIYITPLRDEREINTALSAILSDVPVDASTSNLVVGFDCKWNFSQSDFGRTDRGDISVILIAYKDRVLILQVGPFIARRQLPLRLQLFLQNPRVLKAGHLVSSDLKQLENLVHPSSPFVGALELGKYAKARRAISKANCSLPDLCASIFKTCLHKDRFLDMGMDWERPNLTKNQQYYAACDAYVRLELYRYLSGFVIPSPIRKTTPISTPVIVYQADGTSIIAEGLLADRKDAEERHNLKMTAGQVAVEVTRVLIPGAIVSSQPKRSLSDLGQPPFYLAALRRHVYVVDGRVFNISDSNPDVGAISHVSNRHGNQSATTLQADLIADIEETPSERAEGGQSVGELLRLNTQGVDPDGNDISVAESDSISGVNTETITPDLEMCTVSGTSSARAAEALSNLEQPDPAWDNVLRTRVLKDVFHVFNMIKLSPSHGLAKDFARRLRDILLVPDIEDRARISSWAATLNPPQSFEQLQATRPKWLWKHCRRVIRPPSVIFPLVKNLFMTYGPLEDAVTGLPLFAAHNWKIARNILGYIHDGYISDPPGIPLYSLTGLDRSAGNLPVYRCSRGTNFTEGGIHTHLRSRLPSSGASLRHMNAGLNDFTLGHNERIEAMILTGRSHRSHYEPWLTNKIQERLIVLQNHDMLETEPIQIKGWINTNFYVPTKERIGIVPVAAEVRNTFGMAEYQPAATKKQPHQYLAQMQGTRKAILPVHTPAEKNLFQRLLEENNVFRSLPSNSSWIPAAQIWNEYADANTDVFYKTKDQLKSYFTKYQRRIDVRQSLAQTSDIRRPLIQALLDPSCSVAAPSSSSGVPGPRAEHQGPTSGLFIPSDHQLQPQPVFNTDQTTLPPTRQIQQQPVTTAPPPLSEIFAALAQQNVASDFAGTVGTAWGVPKTRPTGFQDESLPAESVYVQDPCRRPRRCMKCGKDSNSCPGSQCRAYCKAGCQDCGQITCKGRNSKRPNKPCWEGWLHTKHANVLNS